MNHIKKRLFMALLAAAMLSMLAVGVHAADYSFTTDGTPEYYSATSYEEIYGSLYNYGGINVVDYMTPELEYGFFSTTQTGIMEKALLPGLQQSVFSAAGGAGYGITTEDGVFVAAPEIQRPSSSMVYQQPAYTSVEGMKRSDGSIGTLKIPALDISMKVWEGETDSSMSKGLGHYSSTSAWDGNVGICGHNRGAKYSIGEIKGLEIGDAITYTTIHGTRTYEVVLVETIDSTDWGYLQSSYDNRITITTCLANRPEKRICVQAVQKFD